MIEHLIIAVVVAVIVGLVCLLIGRLIASVGGVPILTTLGEFLTQYCWVIGLLAGLLWFFTGSSFFGFGKGG